MRNLIDVIDEMLKVVPKGQEQIISYLKDIQDSQKCRAPENMIGWYQVSEMLQEFEFNKKTPMWQLKMCSIFSTQPLEKILKELNRYNLWQQLQRKICLRLSRICRWMRR